MLLNPLGFRQLLLHRVQPLPGLDLRHLRFEGGLLRQQRHRLGRVGAGFKFFQWRRCGFGGAACGQQLVGTLQTQLVAVGARHRDQQLGMRAHKVYDLGLSVEHALAGALGLFAQKCAGPGGCLRALLNHIIYAQLRQRLYHLLRQVGVFGIVAQLEDAARDRLD